MTRWIVILIVVLVLGLGAGAFWYTRRDTGGGGFQTVAVTRGELQAVIGATGTVEPEEVVDIGAQVQGQIASFGTDADGKPVDNNSTVDAGMVLAKIDDALYAADKDSAQAAVDSAKANVRKAQADLNQMQAKLAQAQGDWERAQQVGPSEALAKTAYDAYRYGFDTAKANVDVAEAQLVQAQKGVTQAEATLQRAARNLDYCTITAPAKGTIISRRVNIGQTVVASLNAPSLFLLAKDLSRIEVWASVNEADIANIKAGQDVTFTVDTFPDRVFHGKVSRVRLDATMTQNVVTYPVEITADNSDRTLRPYLTANVSFQVARHDDVLMVPNAALRWSPSSAEQVTPSARSDADNQSGANGASAREPAAPGGTAAARTTQPAGSAAGPPSAPAGGDGERHKASAERRRGTLWVEDGKYVRPVPVRLGLTDGANTEIHPIKPDDLKEGSPVVVGEARADDTVGTGDAKNPFAPQFRRRSGGK